MKDCKTPMNTVPIMLITLGLILGAMALLISCQLNSKVLGVAGIADTSNRCPYEGAECPNAQYYMRSYQLAIHMDTIRVYDGDRLVKVLIDSTSAIHNAIVEDNQ